MATLAVQRVTSTGVVISGAAAAAGGDKFPPGEVVLRVVNGGASPCIVGIVLPGTVQNQPVGDISASVPAGQTWHFGPFPRADFAGSDGLVSVTYSQVTSVTVAVFSF